MSHHGKICKQTCSWRLQRYRTSDRECHLQLCGRCNLDSVAMAMDSPTQQGCKSANGLWPDILLGNCRGSGQGTPAALGIEDGQLDLHTCTVVLFLAAKPYPFA